MLTARNNRSLHQKIINGYVPAICSLGAGSKPFCSNSLMNSWLFWVLTGLYMLPIFASWCSTILKNRIHPTDRKLVAYNYVLLHRKYNYCHPTELIQILADLGYMGRCSPTSAQQGFAAGLLNSTSLGSNLQRRTMNMIFVFMNPHQKIPLLHLITLIHLICIADENCKVVLMSLYFHGFVGGYGCRVRWRPGAADPAKTALRNARIWHLGFAASLPWVIAPLGFFGTWGPPNSWIVHNGKSHESGWFLKPIFGNLHDFLIFEHFGSTGWRAVLEEFFNWGLALNCFNHAVNPQIINHSNDSLEMGSIRWYERSWIGGLFMALPWLALVSHIRREAANGFMMIYAWTAANCVRIFFWLTAPGSAHFVLERAF